MSLLPKPKDLAIQAAIHGTWAYQAAKKAAAMGVEPELASQYGQKVSGIRYALWWCVPITGLMAFFAIGGNWIMALWGVGHLALLWLLCRRYKAYRDTDPRLKLRYSVSTPTVILTTVAWLLVGLLGVGVALLGPVLDVGPRPKPTVITLEVPRHHSTPTAPQTGQLT